MNIKGIIKKILLIEFQMTFLHSRNAVFWILKIYQAITKKLGIKHLMTIVLISLILPAFLKYERKKWGQRCNFWAIGQNIKILFTFIHVIYVNFFSKSWLLISTRIVLKYYLNPVSNIPSSLEKTAPLE